VLLVLNCGFPPMPWSQQFLEFHSGPQWKPRGQSNHEGFIGTIALRAREEITFETDSVDVGRGARWLESGLRACNESVARLPKPRQKPMVKFLRSPRSSLH